MAVVDLAEETGEVVGGGGSADVAKLLLIETGVEVGVCSAKQNSHSRLDMGVTGTGVSDLD